MKAARSARGISMKQRPICSFDVTGSIIITELWPVVMQAVISRPVALNIPFRPKKLVVFVNFMLALYHTYSRCQHRFLLFFTDHEMSPGTDPVAGRTMLYGMSSLPSRREGRDDPRDVVAGGPKTFFTLPLTTGIRMIKWQHEIRSKTILGSMR